MVEQSESTSATKEVIFRLADGKTVTAHPLLNEVSGFLKDFLKTSPAENPSEEVPINQGNTTVDELNLMNRLFENIEEKELHEHAEDLSHWMSFIPQKKETLLPLAKDVDKDVLIRGSNLGDYLIVYPFLAFCTYVLSERCQDMKLVELREYLNEEDDFDAEQRRIIDECPEFKNL